MLGSRLTLGHGVWLTEDDIELVAETGTMICHNASSKWQVPAQCDESRTWLVV